MNRAPETPEKLYLSPPHMGSSESRLLQEALDSNWIAPLGPFVDRFEREFAAKFSAPNALATNTGTAALHLALRVLGVGRGDRVICPSLTFIATANPVLYQGAEPIFIDSEDKSWNIDPELLEEELETASRRDELPKAVIVVDVLGQSADWAPILEVGSRFDIPVIEDAAEALGASYRGRPVGSFGLLSAFSFNGNKIITTSGGGMLVSSDAVLIRHARYLATQARDPAPHYEHSEWGYNYRLSNLLAAVGVGQLEVLEERVSARRSVFEYYARHLGTVEGLSFMPELEGTVSTRWLTVLMIDPVVFGADREEVRRALEEHNIESRPVWKPLHMQPVFKDCRFRGGGVAEHIFERGLCLPSGSSLTRSQQDRVIEVILSCRG